MPGGEDGARRLELTSACADGEGRISTVFDLEQGTAVIVGDPGADAERAQLAAGAGPTRSITVGA